MIAILHFIQLICHNVLSIENRAKVAARYKVVQFVVTEQRWGCCVKGVNESLRNYKNCHGKLMETGSVTGKKRPSRRRSAVAQWKMSEGGWRNVPPIPVKVKL